MKHPTNFIVQASLQEIKHFIMKKLFYAVSSLVIIAATQSCNKNMNHVSKQIVIDTTLASGSEYLLNLQPYGDQDDVANISKQAASFTTSEIVNASGTFAPVYHYSSVAKESHTDQVILSITEGNHGNGNQRPPSDSTTITINFTIK